MPDLPPGISWTGGMPTYHALGAKIMFGPMIVKCCVTKTGARFGAWRRRRAT